MNYRELVRLATEPGPMQELALQALAEEFAADERTDYMGGRNEQFDIARFAPQYMDAKMAAPRVPRGDMGRAEEEDAIRREAEAELMAMYERQYPEPMLERVGRQAGSVADYLTSAEGVNDTATMLRDSFAPAYSQLDSYNWAQDNLRKYHELSETDPLTATGYLPLAGIGYIGSVPGLSAVVSGGRKLGQGAKLLYEGLY